MYNESKGELLTKIADGLNSRVWCDVTADNEAFSPEYGMVSCLGFLPEENLKKIIDIGFENEPCFNALYQRWGRANVFKMDPYISQEPGVPTLVLRHNRFIHLIRNAYFQVSGDPDGTTSCTFGLHDISFLTNLIPWDRVRCSGTIAYLLWWAALIEVGIQFDVFRAACQNKIEVIDDFLTAVINAATINYFEARGYNHSTFNKYVTLEHGSINKSQRKVHHVMKAGEVQAYLAVGTNSIEVETAGERLVTVNIPSIYSGTGLYPVGKEAVELKEAQQIYDSNHYLEMLSVLALNISGLHVSKAGIRWLERRHYDVLDSIIPTVSNLNDLGRLTPDDL